MTTNAFITENKNALIAATVFVGTLALVGTIYLVGSIPSLGFTPANFSGAIHAAFGYGSFLELLAVTAGYSLAPVGLIALGFLLYHHARSLTIDPAHITVLTRTLIITFFSAMAVFMLGFAWWQITSWTILFEMVRTICLWAFYGIAIALGTMLAFIALTYFFKWALIPGLKRATSSVWGICLLAVIALLIIGWVVYYPDINKRDRQTTPRAQEDQANMPIGAQDPIDVIHTQPRPNGMKENPTMRQPE